MLAYSEISSKLDADKLSFIFSGLKQCDFTSDKETSAPPRKVKAPLHRCTNGNLSPERKPSRPPEPPAEAVSSSDQWCGRRTRSSQRQCTAKRILQISTVPQEESRLEKSQRSTRRKHGTTSLPTAAANPEPSVNDGTSLDEPSIDDSSIRRKRRGNRGHRNVGEKSQPSHMSEESGKGRRTGARETDKRDAAQKATKHKCTKTSKPPKTLPKSTQSVNKHKAAKGNKDVPQEQDEDKWTEEECVRLKE